MGIFSEMLECMKRVSHLPDKKMKCPRCKVPRKFKYEESGLIGIRRCPECGYKKVVTQFNREFPDGLKGVFS